MMDPGTMLSFLKEDMPFGDLTSEAVIPADLTASAVIRAKEACVIAGLEEAAFLFDHLGAGVVTPVKDGDAVAAGTIVMEIRGPARAVLAAERTALNIIGRMSGIATAAREAVDAVRAVDPVVRVASTRKTCPGLRTLDKKAAMLGGAVSHRFSLSDMVMIKDNHLALVGLEEAVRRAKAHSPYHKVEVEVESAKDAVRAAEYGADIVLLDNMTPEGVREAVAALMAAGQRDNVVVEISGGVSRATLPLYAGAGADIISMGALTHSVRNVDVGLDVVPDGE
ncbi:carboxylating nicotinate-nucleotide diphosphorylase [Methanofollis ethanolicus]|uniref:carboxylating nicotinate-nucleotide diphosphorylase n=1 Tax=Methanofollis ethanolicus TaxID=488124 RepID=UPI00083503A5|nr:carboxylating nicotinate-nucleotide diphosphorylase [Methanofollis ethanolicus]